jgi:hypothetical protein
MAGKSTERSYVIVRPLKRSTSRGPRRARLQSLDSHDTGQTRFRKSRRKVSSTFAGELAFRSPIRWSPGTTGDPRQHPPLRTRHRRRQPALDGPRVREKNATRDHSCVAEFSIFDESHRVGLLRWSVRCSCHVGVSGLDVAQVRPARRRHHHERTSQGPDRAQDAFRGPLDTADLPHRFFQPARRQGRRMRLMGLPHRTRRGARARHEVHGGAFACRTVHG